jgi:hypothetical protein
MKNKRLLICICTLILLVVAGAIVFLLTNKKKESSNPTTTQAKTYEMYVKINPLVKLIFEQTFEKCTDADGNEYVCENPSFNVVDYELVNNDAKNIYKDLDLFGVDLSDAIALLCDTARDNNIDFNQVEVTTDYYDFSSENMIKDIKEGSKYHSEYSVVINIKDNINKDDLLTDEEKNEVKEYAVIFNSDGGSKVETQILKEGEKVTKPADPTKAGYNFISWQKDGIDYNFDLEVKEDLKLRAKWERNGEETTTKSTKVTTTTTTTTQKTEDPHKGYINLNEKVLYVDATTCGHLEYIVPECRKITIQELINKYGTTIDEDYKEWIQSIANSALEEEAGDGSINTFISMFPTCFTSPPSNIESQALSLKIAGWKVIKSNDILDLETISLQNYDKYNKFIEYPVDKLKKLGLFDTSACGGGGDGDVTWNTLDENACSKYNLKCDRW